jgi:NADH dehydrogenase FAD-containing subunit
MQPNISEAEQLRLLHFQTVGGGPTGVEFSAELHDFIKEDLSQLYPSLMNKVRMTLYDVAPRILGSFDGKLAEYAAKRFTRGGVHLRTGTKVIRVDQNSMVVNDNEVVPYGMLVWATGITQGPLIQGIKDVAKDPKGTGRLLTNGLLQVLDTNGMPLESVYALGDCATIKGTLTIELKMASPDVAKLLKLCTECPYFVHRVRSTSHCSSRESKSDISRKTVKQI